MPSCALQVVCRQSEVFALGCAVARCFPLYSRVTQQSKKTASTVLVTFLVIQDTEGATSAVTDEDIRCLNDACKGGWVWCPIVPSGGVVSKVGDRTHLWQMAPTLWHQQGGCGAICQRWMWCQVGVVPRWVWCQGRCGARWVWYQGGCGVKVGVVSKVDVVSKVGYHRVCLHLLLYVSCRRLHFVHTHIWKVSVSLNCISISTCSDSIHSGDSGRPMQRNAHWCLSRREQYQVVAEPSNLSRCVCGCVCVCTCTLYSVCGRWEANSL